MFQSRLMLLWGEPGQVGAGTAGTVQGPKQEPHRSFGSSQQGSLPESSHESVKNRDEEAAQTNLFRELPESLRSRGSK